MQFMAEPCVGLFLPCNVALWPERRLRGALDTGV
jgi:hypothetical protein